MTDFIFFLGRFHVLALHLPIGMLLLTVALDILSRRQRHASVAQVLPLCWAATAITATFTVVLGLMHFAEGGFDGPSASAHRNYGIGVAASSLAVWFLVACLPPLYLRVRTASNALLLFLVTMTGHYGGNLTHGSSYLVEYAPETFRALAGMPARRATPTDVALADPWHDVVRPILQSRCMTCHNADKQRGQLDLSSLEALHAGGEHGAVITPGSSAGSDLYRRITLSPEHVDYMPAEGKTALSSAQVAIVGWWIDAGLPADTTINQLAADATITELLAMELGLVAPELSATASYPLISREALDQLIQQGWQVRQLSQQSNGLIVSVLSPGQHLSRAMLEALAAAGASIVELNLAAGGLTDDMLALLADMPSLETLDLGSNQLGDAGLGALSSFKTLRVLNIHGNPGITDAGLGQLQGLSKLERIYLWGTSTSSEGVAELATVLPQLAVHGESVMAAAQ
jgi:uncharacterized membrane protein